MNRPAITLRERSRTIDLSFYGVPFSVPDSPLPAGSVALEWDASQAPGVVHYRLHLSGIAPRSIDLGPCTSTTVHGLRSPEDHVFTVAAFYPGEPCSEFDHSNAVVVLPKPNETKTETETDIVKRPAFLPRPTKPVRDFRKTVDFLLILLIALGLLAVCGIILLLLMTHHNTISAPARRSPADRLRALRKRMKLSQKGFSEVIGVSSRNIENWEQGRYYPSPGIMVIVDLMERGIISDVREPAAAPEILPEEEKI